MIQWFMQICLLSLFIFIPSVSFSTLYYVDNAASGDNDGSSWENAWQSLTKLNENWGSISGGDTIYISGGSTSKTYTITSTERITIGANGTSLASPITIRAGQDANHNGVVIFDLQTTQTGAITATNRDFFVIDGEYNETRHFKFINSNYQSSNGAISCHTIDGVKITYVEIDGAGSGIYFLYPNEDADATRVCEISYCYLTDIRYEVGIDCDGAALNCNPGDGCYDSVLIHHNTIEVNNAWNSSGSGPDAIQGSRGVSVYNNTITGQSGSITGSTQHQDAVQPLGLYWKIYNNIITNMGNAAVMGLDSTGYFRFYNNVCSLTSTVFSGYHRGVNMKNETSTDLVDYYIVGNTFVDYENYYAFKLDCTSGCVGSSAAAVVIKNNIFYNCGKPGNYCPVYIDPDYSAGNGPDIDYNVVYAGDYGEDCITCDDCVDPNQNGSTSQPIFVSYTRKTLGNDLSLASNDTVAMDKGLSLGSPFDSDILGVSRPQGSGYDIGAYEYDLGTEITITGMTLGPGVSIQ